MQPSAPRPPFFASDRASPDAGGPGGDSGRWWQQLVSRVRLHAHLKFWASAAIMVGFFVGYFLLLKFPITQPTVMPGTMVDRWIPFRPQALWLYVSLWAYVQIAPALLKSRPQVIAYGKGVILLSLLGFLVFLIWPTKLAPTTVDVVQHAAFRELKEVDATGNACPSLHVAFAVFSALSIGETLRQVSAPKSIRLLNVLWCLGIAYSTLATRQHVFLDVVAGTLLALAALTWYRFNRPVA